MKYPALIVVALVLLATVVTGRESEPAPAPVRASYSPPETLRLTRERNDAAIEDIFAVPQPPAPVVAPKVEAVAVPAAPPLPYSYLGRMHKGERVTLYLLRSQEMVIAEEGAVLEGTYRLEQISETSARFVYLPLGTEQMLAIPPAP